MLYLPMRLFICPVLSLADFFLLLLQDKMISQDFEIWVQLLQVEDALKIQHQKEGKIHC